MKRLLEQEWQKFLSSPAIPSVVTPEETEIARKLFFTGAMAALHAVVNLQYQNPKVAEAALAELATELNEFREETLAKFEKRAAN